MKSKLPLFFHEIDVNCYDYFEFKLPPCYNLESGEGIVISIKHGVSLSDKNKIICEVWAQIGDMSLKGQIVTFAIDKPENSDARDNIINSLNTENSDEFEKALEAFVDWRIKSVKK
jgi:hypothetical protein